MSLENFARLIDCKKHSKTKMDNPFQLTEEELEILQRKYRNLIDEVMSMINKTRH